MVVKKVVKKSLPLYDASGNKSGKTAILPEDIFGTKVNDKLLATSVRVFLTNKRAWSAVTKTRSDINASKRKIYRQKGTGRARHGAISAPIFVGGGVAHGPKAKNIKLKLNKKQAKKALLGALSRAKEANRIYLISESVNKLKPNTKKIEKLLKKLNLYEKKILLICSDEKSNNLKLSVRNLKNVEFSRADNLNAYQVLSNEILLIMQDSIPNLTKHFTENEK
ncbi:MAG: 50S ribosomal protein L4 [bacterium]